MIFVAGISIALFISALLLTKKEKSKPDIILLIWMVVNAIHIALFYMVYTNEIYNYPHLLGLKFPLPLAHGVLLYFYVSSVTNQFPNNKSIAALHFIPIVCTLLYLIPFFLLPADQKIEVFKNKGKGYEVFQFVLLVSVCISGVAYVIWSALLLDKHKKRIKNQFSDIEEINLRWLQFLTFGLGLVWCIVILTRNDSLIFVGVSIFVVLIGFFGVQQKAIFDNSKPTPAIINQPIAEINTPQSKEDKTEKYSKSGLSNQLAEQLHQKLKHAMAKEELYKNSDLSLADLARQLETHPNYLSQIINDKEGKNFYDYINDFRVNEFKRLISIPQNQQFTLMAIAYDCGFNSKSSFNRYFKKITNQTPSQYVKSLKPVSQD